MTTTPQAATVAAVDAIESRLAQQLPDEAHAIAAVAEGARRWAASGGDIGAIRRVVVNPTAAGWHAYLTDAQHAELMGLYRSAIDRCEAGEAPITRANGPDSRVPDGAPSRNRK
jgi:hypothetical protein